MRDRDRLVPARPARARPPGADGGRTARPTASCRVFVLDPRLLDAGRFPSANRAWFLLASLRELRDVAARARRRAVRARAGGPRRCCRALARETGAEAVHFASDVSPFALARDRRVDAALGARRGAPASRQLRRRRRRAADVGRPAVQRLQPVLARAGSSCRGARCTARRARSRVPAGLDPGAIPDGPASPRPPSRSPPGEAAARERLRALARRRDRALRTSATTGSPAARRSSRPTCTSAASRRARSRQRARAKGGEGAAAFVRQLAWRDFYAHVLLHHPGNARRAHRRAFDALEWDDDPEALDGLARRAAPASRSSTPAMRQLAHQGWMHNRARLIVGSFLTKDLHLDWRAGEAHFMRHLLCGDEAQNNGNWQWIASVGVDPGAVLPAHVQPGRPAAPPRPGRRVRAPLVPGAARRAARASSPSRGR